MGKLHSDNDLITLACARLRRWGHDPLHGWMHRDTFYAELQTALRHDLRASERLEGIAQRLIERGLVETRADHEPDTCQHCGQDLPDGSEVVHLLYRLTTSGRQRGKGVACG